MSEYILKVGKKGEIYTTKEIRAKTGIREDGFVKAEIIDGKLVIEPIISVEEKIKKHIAVLDPKDAEKLSEEAQIEAGIFG